MKKKQALVIALCIFALSAASWVVWWRLQVPQRLPIQAVKITGQLMHTNRSALQALILPFIENQNFLTLDTIALRARLESLPWIATVSISRLWPDTLVVQVTEQIPVAIWQTTHLLTAQGDIFSPPVASFPEELVRLQGPDGQQKTIFAQYQTMQRLLNPLQLSIRQVNVSARQAWRLQLSTGMVILLGRTQSLERLKRFSKVYPSLVAPEGDRIDRVDLRYPQGLALHWKDSA